MSRRLPPPTAHRIAELVKNKHILLIDKPSGYTSHYLVNGVRMSTGIRCVGHAGTLDPLASGLMIVLVGRDATRLQDHFLHLPKSYEFTAALGYETDTYDSTGEVVSRAKDEDVAALSQAKIESALQMFLGESDQQVPAYSAVKVDGRALYHISRLGQTAERPTKRIKIFALELTNFSPQADTQPATFSCTVHCGSGTYIRSLAVDIGRALGVGATITQLRRTQVGQFSLSEAQPWVFAPEHMSLFDKLLSLKNA